MIDTSEIRDALNMINRKKLLDEHPYEIWQGRNGKWYTYLPDKKKGRVQRERRTKKEIEDIVVAYWKEQMENPTIREVFEEWNDRRLSLGKISEASHLRYNQIFKRHYSGGMGDCRIKSVQEDEFADFLEEQIAEQHLTAKSFSSLKCITKGLLKRAKKRRLIDFDVERLMTELDVSDSDFKKTIKEDYQEVFSEEETPIIISYLIENLDPMNLAILLLFISGARIGEIVTLKHCDISDKTISIRRTETRYNIDHQNIYEVKEFPKTEAGVRTVVIPDGYCWVLPIVKELNPTQEFIFMRPDGIRMNTQNVRRRLYRVCKKLNIYPKSPHKVRKTYGTILLDNQVDRRLITDQMGHTDIACTETHYHRNRRNVDRKSEIISRIPDFAPIR